MARSSITTKGRIREDYADGVAIQPGYMLTEKNDGTIEGTVTYECDRNDIGRLPLMYTPHPRDSRAIVYNRDITFLGLDKVQMVASYFGLIARKTPSVISYIPNTDKEPVETHPLFESFAGTKTAPLNGAKFDSDTGEFLGFFNPAIKELYGATHYLVPSTMVELSYWQNTVPSVSRRMSIKPSVKGFRKPSDVKDFLLLDLPYRQIGPFYQVTEQYLGSGPLGWSTILYP